MARPAIFNFELNQFNNLDAIVKAIRRRTSRAMSLSVFPVQERLRKSVVNGGDRIRGFSSTNTWKWISSPEGLGQIGFTDASQATAVFQAIEQSIRVKTANQSGSKILLIGLLNMMVLARATPHPATSSTPKLNIESWFVDWILDQKSVTDAGFVDLRTFLKTQTDRGRKIRTYPRSFNIAGLGGAGFMLPGGFSGSRGTWRVPAGVGGEDIRQWLAGNIPGIRFIIEDELSKAFLTLG